MRLGERQRFILETALNRGQAGPLMKLDRQSAEKMVERGWLRATEGRPSKRRNLRGQLQEKHVIVVDTFVITEEGKKALKP